MDVPVADNSGSPTQGPEAQHLTLAESARATAEGLYYGVTRKFGEDIPYAVHPAEVAVVVAENGGDEITIAAAFLHDVLEVVDPKVYNKTDMLYEFGHEVTAIVVAMTKPREGDNRSQIQMEQIIATGSARAVMVFAADKAVGARTLASDLRKFGDQYTRKDFWDKFHGGARGQILKYVAALEFLRAHVSTWPITSELAVRIEELTALVDKSEEFPPDPSGAAAA